MCKVRHKVRNDQNFPHESQNITKYFFQSNFTYNLGHVSTSLRPHYQTINPAYSLNSLCFPALIKWVHLFLSAFATFQRNRMTDPPETKRLWSHGPFTQDMSHYR